MKVIPVSAMLLALELAITAQAYTKELQFDTLLDLNRPHRHPHQTGQPALLPERLLPAIQIRFLQ
jgi:hypothetical protein